VIWQMIFGALGGVAFVAFVGGGAAALLLGAPGRRPGAPEPPRAAAPATLHPLEGVRLGLLLSFPDGEPCEDDYLAREPPRERKETGDAK